MLLSVLKHTLNNFRLALVSEKCERGVCSGGSFFLLLSFFSSSFVPSLTLVRSALRVGESSCSRFIRWRHLLSSSSLLYLVCWQCDTSSILLTHNIHILSSFSHFSASFFCEGPYTNSQGIAYIRQEVADFIEVGRPPRNSPLHPYIIFSFCASFSPRVWVVAMSICKVYIYIYIYMW